ncbi:hypothetical protein GWI33_008588 [Rhynchophorus ferrugineus]|uniref:Uncharacterized protein n=1 Tax=Rhynchophorus ferrugineus TaxID=354439 RepID=A0A834MAW5_RHYFE|nr:hypothetical protein GWI33_008588 [Rhynchophorus ferrugineus]
MNFTLEVHYISIIRRYYESYFLRLRKKAHHKRFGITDGSEYQVPLEYRPVIELEERRLSFPTLFQNSLEEKLWMRLLGKVDQEPDLALLMVFLAKAPLCLKTIKFSNIGEDLKRDSARFLSLITWVPCPLHQGIGLCGG